MVVAATGFAWIAGLLAQCEPQQGGGGSSWSGFVMIALIFVIFYFLLIRPQQRKQKEHQKMVESLKKGDRVITSGGVYGTVVGVKDNIVVLKIAENVKVEFAKSAVSHILPGE
jgi:preprotein translocase subunit YajC